MRRSLKSDYRDSAYRLRAHPRQDEIADFVDRRDSLATVYFSSLPFAIAEYFTEVSYELIPGGLVFPVGFLLFWAFYYTYYKPGILENHLVAPSQGNWMAVPALLVGVLIWFVKVTLVELGHLVVFQWFQSKPAPKPQKAFAPRAAPAPKSAPPLLSADLIAALEVLGLKPGCRWTDIHHRYRVLAKKYHPDLNRESTDIGRRFMRVDDAYHRLSKVRYRHFPD